jgi:hypothetical protein
VSCVVRTAATVASLIRDANPHGKVDAEEVRSWLTPGLVDPDDMRVLEEDGARRGYVDLFVREELAYLAARHVSTSASGCVSPYAPTRGTSTFSRSGAGLK